MLGTRFTELVGCTLPLQLAGMGGVGTVELAVAVARVGGLGMLPGLADAPVEDQLRRAKGEADSGAVGVNFLMPFVDRAEVERAGAGGRVVEFFFGDPDPSLVALAHEGGALASWQVGSVEEARAAAGVGSDLIVAQGVEAGGHVRGLESLLPLLDAVLEAVDVPVVAAGGIATGSAMAAALAAGADAVRVGTRFVATKESGAHPEYVARLLRASGRDTVLTTAFGLGWPDAPHRVLRSAVESAHALAPDAVVGQMVMQGQCIPVGPFWVGPPTRETTGAIGAMALYAGQGVGAVTKVESASDVARELCQSAEERLRHWA